MFTLFVVPSVYVLVARRHVALSTEDGGTEAKDAELAQEAA